MVHPGREGIGVENGQKPSAVGMKETVQHLNGEELSTYPVASGAICKTWTK
jgi:hypothetical protein